MFPKNKVVRKGGFSLRPLCHQYSKRRCQRRNSTC